MVPAARLNSRACLVWPVAMVEYTLTRTAPMSENMSLQFRVIDLVRFHV